MNKKKLFTIVASSLLTVCLAVGSTLAYIYSTTDPVNNTFTEGSVTTSVFEDEFDGVTKSNVKIENTGNIDAYIRAKVVVTWQKEEDNKKIVSSVVPKLGEDYQITFNPNGDWFYDKDEDIWYHKSSVKPTTKVNGQEVKGLTGVLIQSATVSSTAKKPEGYELSIEILGSGIQATGVETDGTNTPAVVDAWKVTLNADKTISK